MTYFCSLLDIKVPEDCRPVLGSEDCTTTKPIELTRDRTVVFTSPEGRAELAICFEVQLKVDPSREWAWPLYLAKLRFDLKCPVVLMVLTPSPSVVRWCSEGFDLGHPGLILCPLPLGPDKIDKITDPEQAKQNIQLAFASALTHGDGPLGPAILDALAEALDTTDTDTAAEYAEILLSALKSRGKLHMEHLMETKDFQYTSDYAKRLEARGEANALLLVLKARGIPVTGHAHDRIHACTDTDQLERWITRAATIDHIDELFAE